MNDADYFDACYDIGEDYLAHYGILGQKWGRRRYQNPDGTLTPLGRERLYGENGKMKKNIWCGKFEKWRHKYSFSL